MRNSRTYLLSLNERSALPRASGMRDTAAIQPNATAAPITRRMAADESPARSRTRGRSWSFMLRVTKRLSASA